MLKYLITLLVCVGIGLISCSSDSNGTNSHHQTDSNIAAKIPIAFFSDSINLEAGYKIFKRKCKVCHGKHGEGKIGPNFTDDFWIIEPTAQSMYQLVLEGKPDKGMQSWKNILTHKEIIQVNSFIFSLWGNQLDEKGKDPQGVKYVKTNYEK